MVLKEERKKKRWIHIHFHIQCMEIVSCMTLGAMAIPNHAQLIVVIFQPLPPVKQAAHTYPSCLVVYLFFSQYKIIVLGF